jgi:hypothetical protein
LTNREDASYGMKNKEKKGYYMVQWSRVCRSRNKGGIRVKDLRKQNISLLCKW